MKDEIKPPDLADNKVRLRRWTDEDAAALVQSVNDPDILEAIPDLPQPYGREEARAFIARMADAWQERSVLRFAIEDITSGRAVGDIGLVRIDWDEMVAEIGYWVGADARGKGVATSALSLISRWAFEHLRLERLELYIDPNNDPSRQVAERCGFRAEGVLRSHTWARGGGRSDSVVYGLLPHDLTDAK